VTCARCHVPDDRYWEIIDTAVRCVCSNCLTIAENIAIADFDVVGMHPHRCAESRPASEPIQLPDFIKTTAGTFKPLDECSYDDLASQPSALSRLVAQRYSARCEPSQP